MPGQNPLILKRGGSYFVVSSKIDTVTTSFGDDEIKNAPRIKFSARAVNELEGNVEAGTVLASVSASGDEAAILGNRAESDFVVNEDADSNPELCSNDNKAQCLEIVGGQLKVKSGVEFTTAPSFILTEVVSNS